MASGTPSLESLSFADASEKLVAQSVQPADAAETLGRLLRLGQVVEDHTLAGLPADSIDPSGALEGLDDDELTEWWSRGCWVRELLWSAAADGEAVVLDWMSLMICFAARGRTFDFRRELALDLRDLSRAVARGKSAESAVRAPHQSPVRIASWLNRQRIAAIRPPDVSDYSATSTVWRAWVGGREVGSGDEFDALIQGVIARSETLVVEFEESPRRHVLLPIEPTDDSVIESAFYCIDLTRCLGGWLTPDGEWTWESERDADSAGGAAG